MPPRLRRLLVLLVLGVVLSVQPVYAATTEALYLPMLKTSDTERWQPQIGESWQWQLTDPLDLSIDAAIYDVDLFDTPAATVTELHNQGRHVICYISVGSWEDSARGCRRFSVRGPRRGLRRLGR